MTQKVTPQAQHFGAYLLDGQGNLVSQVDGAGVDSAGRMRGDVFSTFINLNLPPGLPTRYYSLVTALYRYAEIDWSNLVNGGNLLTIEKLTVPSPSPAGALGGGRHASRAIVTREEEPL